MADSGQVVFCNAGPLIALGKLNRLSLLPRLYPNLVVPRARRLGLAVKGTLGVLVAACRARVLALEEVELLVLTLAARADVWISKTLCEQVLAELKRTAQKG